MLRLTKMKGSLIGIYGLLFRISNDFKLVNIIVALPPSKLCVHWPTLQLTLLKILLNSVGSADFREYYKESKLSKLRKGVQLAYRNSRKHD